MHVSEESEGSEPVPVPYRYSLSPARTGKCPVFLPNKLNRKEGEDLSVRLGSCQFGSNRSSVFFRIWASACAGMEHWVLFG